MKLPNEYTPQIIRPKNKPIFTDKIKYAIVRNDGNHRCYSILSDLSDDIVDILEIPGIVSENDYIIQLNPDKSTELLFVWTNYYKWKRLHSVPIFGKGFSFSEVILKKQPININSKKQEMEESINEIIHKFTKTTNRKIDRINVAILYDDNENRELPFVRVILGGEI